jgi:pyrimidine-specific ribonucleoside hydrolase
MPASQSSLPIVIDTDPGIDDVVALALAARSPELDVVAVTTTYGNASLAATTRNARALWPRPRATPAQY